MKRKQIARSIHLKAILVGGRPVMSKLAAEEMPEPAAENRPPLLQGVITPGLCRRCQSLQSKGADGLCPPCQEGDTPTILAGIVAAAQKAAGNEARLQFLRHTYSRLRHAHSGPLSTAKCASDRCESPAPYADFCGTHILDPSAPPIIFPKPKELDLTLSRPAPAHEQREDACMYTEGCEGQVRLYPAGKRCESHRPTGDQFDYAPSHADELRSTEIEVAPAGSGSPDQIDTG